ncbi:hypothetical protein [Thermococcus sp. AM4]|uniref:hypothetical protein n=1 Tax=Thermococcus sp. (strain AM4) TaxID=246969 RepID=UPI00064EC87E|nr:hypothetical protein [Thermococcus sp. AM4]
MRWSFSLSLSILFLLFLAWLPLAILLILPIQETGAPIIMGSVTMPLIFLWYNKKEYLPSLAFFVSFYPLSMLLYLIRDNVPPFVVGFIIASIFVVPAYLRDFEKNTWKFYALVFAFLFSLTNVDALITSILIMFFGVLTVIGVENPRYLSLGLFGMYTVSSIKLLAPNIQLSVLSAYILIGGAYYVITYYVINNIYS